VVVLIAAGYFVLGKDIFRLLGLIRGPMLVGFRPPAANRSSQADGAAQFGIATASPASCCRWATRSTSMAR
jgi:hypothetical protein